MTLFDKLFQLVVALEIFALVMAAVLLVADRVRGRRADWWQGSAFLLPAVLLLMVGLVRPARSVWSTSSSPGQAAIR